MSDAGRPVFTGDHVRATHFGETQRIMVKLDHGRRGREGFPDDGPSRVATRFGYGTLTVTLSRNSWFLTPENPALRTALDALCSKAETVIAMGFSMGGYGALLLSEALHLQRALLFSPQYSIFPARAGWDRRRNRISRSFDERWDDLARQIRPGLTGAILFDPRQRVDVAHARAIAALAPGLTPVAVPFGGHPAHKFMAGKKQFHRVSEAMFLEDDLAAWAHRFRRERREESEAYLTGMTRYLDAREARSTREKR